MIAFNKKTKVAFISSCLPQECGIATFTSDLVDSVALSGGAEFDPVIVAMRSGNNSRHDRSVKFNIHKNTRHDYISAADYINLSNVDIVSLQHEFGLFGGDGGSHLSILLKRLNKPVITTLHTILERPSVNYFNSLSDVCMASDKVIVMNRRGVKMLRDIYDVPEEKIKLIPHGIPDMPFAHNSYYKRKLGMAGRKTILTFGLLSKNKGIEVMLRALPRIIETDPSVLYIILGATHPEVRRRDGQSYLLKLKRMVAQLGLSNNIVFHNRFVEDKKLLEFLSAADIYVTPYLHREQLTSGTLAFAVGAGKAVVSTPYWAAQELLAHGRGKLVRFGDAEHLAQTIVEIFRNDSLFSRMKIRAYEYGRSMTWPRIGKAYWELFCSQVSSVTRPLRSGVDSQDWTIPA